MKITVDIDKCIAGGVCALEAPDYFDLDDDGLVVVLQDEAAENDLPQVRSAAAACPAAVIRLIGDD